MKKLEILITNTKVPKLTVAKDRISIKHNNSRDYSKEIEFLKRCADKIGDVDYTLRGKMRKSDSIVLMSDKDLNKKYRIEKFTMNES